MTEVAPEGPRSAAGSETTKHLRGSTLLLSGRLVSLALNLATQVLIVRLLTKQEYGAFAYALAAVVAARTIVSLGHHQALPRFLSMYEEEGQRSKIVGTIVMEFALAFVAGCAMFVLFAVFGDTVVDSLGAPEAEALLLILIWLAPLEALDRVFEASFAVFSRPRAIFFRKYLLAPTLRLSFVAAVFAAGGSVAFVAAAYVLAALVGIVAYALLLRRLLHERGILGGVGLRSLSYPFGEITRFAAPLMTTELVAISMTTIGVFLLGHFASASEVADYRSVFPAARLNQIAFFTFSVLFVPLATRLYLRRDHAGMRDAYWQTAVWLVVFTFPVFLVTVPLAEPTTVLLFGERYRDSAAVLAVLGAAFFVNAAAGFNTVTLQTYGHVRYVVHVNVAAVTVNVALNLALIPVLDALGVAIANAMSLLFINVAAQIGIRRKVGVPVFPWAYWRLYALGLVLAGVIAAVQLLLGPPVGVGIGLAALASLVFLVSTRKLLDAEATFPEIRRLPLIGRLLASSPTATHHGSS